MTAQLSIYSIYLRFRCPVSCGDCYQDDIDCRGALITDALCAAFAHIRLKCAHTCAGGPIVKHPVPVGIKSVPYGDSILYATPPPHMVPANNILRIDNSKASAPVSINNKGPFPNVVTPPASVVVQTTKS